MDAVLAAPSLSSLLFRTLTISSQRLRTVFLSMPMLGQVDEKRIMPRFAFHEAPVEIPKVFIVEALSLTA